MLQSYEAICDARAPRQVRLRCRHAPPAGGSIQVEVVGYDGSATLIEVDAPGAFWISIDLPAGYSMPAYWSFESRSRGALVPSETEPGSSDARELAFLFEEMVIKN